MFNIPSKLVNFQVFKSQFQVWRFYWIDPTELTIPSPEIKINDGAWHSIKVNRVRQNLDIEIDGEIYNSRVTGSYYELNTANNVLLGKSEI